MTLINESSNGIKTIFDCKQFRTTTKSKVNWTPRLCPNPSQCNCCSFLFGPFWGAFLTIADLVEFKLQHKRVKLLRNSDKGTHFFVKWVTKGNSLDVAGQLFVVSSCLTFVRSVQSFRNWTIQIKRLIENQNLFQQFLKIKKVKALVPYHTLLLVHFHDFERQTRTSNIKIKGFSSSIK